MTSWAPLLFWEAELKNIDNRLAADPGSIELLFERAVILNELGHVEETQNAYIEILTKAPTHFGALNNLGALLMSMDLSTAAIIAYQEAVKHHPDNPKGHANLADTLFKKGRMEEALHHFKTALQIDPNYKTAHQGIAYILREMGDEENARIHRRKGFESNYTIIMPYHGNGFPIVLVMLASSMGGMIPMRHHLDNRIFHTTVVFVEFYDPDIPLPPHQLIVNAIGDADLCATDLDAALRLLQNSKAPIINHPDAVRLTGRMDNARRFAGGGGIITPKIITLSREALAKDTVSSVLSKHGFTFPFLLRSPGFHTGRNFVRVDSRDDLKSALSSLPGSELMAIEYLDASGTDGKIRKYRVMMIDGKFYPVHAAISLNWKVHYFSAEMENAPENRAEDEYFLNHMDEVLGPRAMKALENIRDTLALDYAGIDFGLNKRGDVLFFEANANMVVNMPPKDALWKYRNAPIQKIFDAVRAMLTGKAKQINPNEKPVLPPVMHMLTTGGDKRIVRDPKSGMNQYGCPSVPEPKALAYGSATASIISSAGFIAAENFRQKLQHTAGIELPSVTYARELNRIRTELIRLNNLERLSPDIIFAASGTDVHLLVSQLVNSPQAPSLRIIIVEGAETGSGVHAAIHSQHFGDSSAFASYITKGKPIDGAGISEVMTVASRNTDGTPRPAPTIDSEIEALAGHAVAAGQRVLLLLIDVSKTGLIVPSTACARALKKRFPAMVDVLVDACQFRISPSTLRAYLKNDFLIAITGSKFVTGPAFSGALLVPKTVARRLRTQPLSSALSEYSTRSDWPEGWAARAALVDGSNYGLLLRWEAALVELRAFRALPEDTVADFLNVFAKTLCGRFATDPVFEPLLSHALERRPIVMTKNWDCIPTIFPFLLRRAGSGYLSRKETAQVYERLRKNHCYVGQPVICGTRDGTDVSALRICADMRLVVDALSPQGRGAKAVIAEALLLLDKAAVYAAQPDV